MRITNRDLTCVHCGAPNDAAAGPSRRDIPEAGDVVMCYRCGGLSIFTTKATRKATPEEEAELLQDPDIIRARELMRKTSSAKEIQDKGWEDLT